MPSLMRYVNIISRSGVSYRSERLSDTDLNGFHTSYLINVCRHPGISQDKLAEKLCINKSNVTRNLVYLEQHGYIERHPSEEDRRVMQVFPTEKALDILPRILDIVREWNGYITSDFSDEEMEMFLEMMSRASARAKEYAKRHSTEGGE